MISLRKATIEDAKMLFEWRNDKDVRESSFNTSEIEFEDHLIWYERKLEAEDSVIYIAEISNIPVGVIRLDDVEDKYKLINFSIELSSRNKGYAAVLLKLIKEEFASCILIGEVKKDNAGSVKAFIKAGYFMEEKLRHFVFYSQPDLKR